MIEPTGLKAGQWVWLLRLDLTRHASPALLLTSHHGDQEWSIRYQQVTFTTHWPAEYMEPASLEDVARSQLAGLEGL